MPPEHSPEAPDPPAGPSRRTGHRPLVHGGHDRGARRRLRAFRLARRAVHAAAAGRRGAVAVRHARR